MEGFPVIDVSGLRDGDLAERLRVGRALGKACREVGFFYVVGHGIPDPLRDGVFEGARQFFESPDEDKDRVSIRLSKHNRGYLGFGMERLDETAELERKEAYNIGLELPADDPELLAGVRFRGPNQWPDLPGWRGTMLDYYAACHSLDIDIHRGLALDLGLDEQFFTDKIDRPGAFLRLLRYPAAAEGDAPGKLAAGEHTDYGTITILTTNGVGGLQVRRRDGLWLDAPSIDGAFVCNIGDCMMRWTNDVYISTPHRVIQPETERYSVVFFMEPNPDALVQAVPSCIEPGGAAHYAPISAGDYLRQRLDMIYEY
jgi:isopenicillin N synthase-like dioxygenase